MKTHSIAAEILGNPSAGISGHPARRGLAAQVPGRSSRKRVSAMMRLACRVLGLKRRKGLGLALLGACGALLLSGAPALAANGIHINANTSGSCVSINDPQPNQNGVVDSTVATNLNFQDATSRCDASKNTDQKDYVLFFRPMGVSGVGATSLMLGGELHVNSGFIKLGDGATGMRIGNASTTTTNGGIAIGNGAASVNFGTSIGTEAKGILDAASLARDSVASPTAVGYRATANGPYSTALGAEASAAGDRASALGSRARATADSSTAVGYNAAASATNTFAAGINSVASANESVAIGNDAQATHGVSVALGSGSRTRAFSAAAPVVLNGKTYSFDSTNLKGVVSLGSDTQTLQIINVAPGMINATSTDAVNGSQLFAAYDAINTLGVVDETHQAAIELAEVEIDAVRISQAAATASVAQAIGGGATVDAAGKVVMPALALTSLGEGQPQPTTVLGAVGALDRGLQTHAEALRDVTQVAAEANDMASLATRQLQGFGPDETVAGRIDEVKRNSLMWDPGQGAYSANNASSGQNRISNLAEGQAETDAVNKGQLDQAIAQAKGQGDKLVQESGGQLLVGKDSAATAVNLAGVAPQRDANGNAVLDAEGKPVMTPLDRSVTGVAAGVNGNDAVNKGQLDSVAQAADAAQIAATGARQAAEAAQSTAAGAQRAADAAQGTATDAQQAAVAAQAAATGAQQAADAGNAKLAGIADGETVTGLIDQAKKGAVDAAGLAANQSLATALGGNATVGADGKPGAPTYTLSQIGADGGVVAQGQTAANVGAALAAVDANVIKVNERVLAQDAKVGQLTQDVSDLRGDSLLWDADAGAFSAAHGGESPNRLVNLAAGQAATDAVNKGQLDTVAQTAESARSDAAKAQQSAGVAQASAAGALQAAETAQGEATGARQAAEAAQGTASAAQTAAGAAQTAAAGAQQTAEAAQRSATGAQQAAQAAQGSADQAQQSAQAAQGAAAGAQRSADTAQATAENALQAAATAQGTATGAQQSADVASAKLAGIGEGETVAGRIDQATARATEAAGEAAAQSLAAALGGNANVGADGKPGAPSYTVSQIGADGVVAPQGQMAANVGAALAAVDANVIKVNDRVLAQDAKVGQLTQDMSELRSDSLLWDQNAGAFSAAHGQDSPNRIVNLAAGQAATDAVNKGQLDQAVAELKAQGAGLLQEQGGQLVVGKDSAASRVNLAGSAAQRDADGNVIRDGSGNVAVAPVDRTLTGIAAGVAANDAVNKGQLDVVAQRAGAAQSAATGAQQAADAAQGTATGAQITAEAARGTAADARQTADAAQGVAVGAQQSADVARAKLVGIADGETVAGRIAQAAKAATDAAGQAANQSLAAALGGSAAVGADGALRAPSYTVSQIGPDGVVAAQGQTATNVGAALAAVDANVIKVNDRVLAQDVRTNQLTQGLSDLRGDSLLWDKDAGAFSAAHGDETPNRLVNLAAGQAETDAVNKGQLDAVALTAESAQADAAKAQQSANTAQDAATQARQTALVAQGAAATAQNSADAANAKLAGIGSGETVAERIEQASKAASQSLAGALGGGATVRADGTLQGPAYAVTAIGSGGGAQAQSVGNVADAIQVIDGSVAAVNDGVNKVGADVSTMRDQLTTGQLGLVQQDAGTRDITIAKQTDGTRVTLNGAAGARTLSGVKAGEVSEASSEAVTGSQLFSVNRDLLKNSQAVGSLEALTGQQGQTLTGLSNQVRSGNVGLVRHDPSRDTVSVAADRGGKALDVSGTEGVRQVTGLRDGRIQAGSTDAVTGGQMNAVAERVDRLDARGAGVAVDSKGDGSDRAVATPGSRGVAVGANAQATGANSVATGAGASATAANAAAMGAGASAQASGSTAIGANATASAPGSVAIGEGSQATRANTVSVGSAGAERQITHVAPATYDTDAVNLGQASSISRQEAGRALDQANRYTDRRIGQLRQETNAGIASAMAMAALPSTSSPGKSMFSLGTSLYSGESAIAVGLSGRSHNGAWMYRASSSSTRDGEIGAAVGVGYEW